MLGYFNNLEIIQLSHKATSFGDIDKINQVVLDSINDNMTALEKNGKCGAINKTYATTLGYYVIKFMSEI